MADEEKTESTEKKPVTFIRVTFVAAGEKFFIETNHSDSLSKDENIRIACNYLANTVSENKPIACMKIGNKGKAVPAYIFPNSIPFLFITDIGISTPPNPEGEK